MCHLYAHLEFITHTPSNNFSFECNLEIHFNISFNCSSVIQLGLLVVLNIRMRVIRTDLYKYPEILYSFAFKVKTFKKYRI